MSSPTTSIEITHTSHTTTTNNYQRQSESLVPSAVLAPSFSTTNAAPQYAPVPLATQQTQWQADLAAGRPLWPGVGRNDPIGRFASTTPFAFPGSGLLERMEQGSQAASADWVSGVVGVPMGYQGWWPPEPSNGSYPPAASQQSVPNVAYGQQESPRAATTSGMPNVGLFPGNSWVWNFNPGAQNTPGLSFPQSSMSRYPVLTSQEAAEHQSPTRNRPLSSEFEFASCASANDPTSVDYLGSGAGSDEVVDAADEADSIDPVPAWWRIDANVERSNDFNAVNMQDNIFGPIFAPENGIQDWFSGLENGAFLGGGADAPVPTSFGGMDWVACAKENERFGARATWSASPQPKGLGAPDNANASAVLAEVANTTNPLKRKRSVGDDEGTAKKQRASKNAGAGAGKWQQWYCKVEDPSSQPRYRCLVPGCADAAGGKTYALDRGVRRHLTNKHGEMAYKPRIEARGQP
uniref:C2H2-type domain-containing protein n=1 Tax=Mycena chlorophos TaxID=658473 RepID=A0ABQ0LGA6_MYCCL|nr:predicted protein [Mycena chlorophos]